MDLRAWEARLGVRLDALDQADPPALAEIRKRLTELESSLDESVLPLCEELLPLLNLKDARELSELVLRRWPGSELADRLRAESEAIPEERPSVATSALHRAGLTHDDLRGRAWWVVRAFEDMAAGFFADGVVRINFGSFSDLRSLPANRAEIAADWKAHHEARHGPTSAGAVSMTGMQLFRFAHEIDVGDVVVTPVARNRSVSVGLIEGPYDWQDGRHSFRHFRRTAWLRHRISRDRLSASAHEELSQRPTVFPLHRASGDLIGAL